VYYIFVCKMRCKIRLHTGIKFRCASKGAVNHARLQQGATTCSQDCQWNNGVVTNDTTDETAYDERVGDKSANIMVTIRLSLWRKTLVR
jgi:hypothetical protein